MFADDVAEVRAMELANTEATEAAAPLDLPSQRSNGKPMVRCDICDKEFKSVSLRNKHSKIHYEGNYSCKYCGKIFKEIGNRNRHENQVHTTQQFQCMKCEKNFKLYKSLKSHMQKKHSGEDDSEYSDSAGAAEAPVAAVPSTLEPQQELEYLERTLDLLESDPEEVEEVEVEVEVCLTDHLDDLDNSPWVSNEVTLSSRGAEEEEEKAPEREELVPSENMDRTSRGLLRDCEKRL